MFLGGKVFLVQPNPLCTPAVPGILKTPLSGVLGCACVRRAAVAVGLKQSKQQWLLQES